MKDRIQQRIIDLMTSRGYTQKQLAELAGVSECGKELSGVSIYVNEAFADPERRKRWDYLIQGRERAYCDLECFKKYRELYWQQYR